MCRLSSACRALILCVAADRGLDRSDFLEPAEEADVWSEPNVGSADGLTDHHGAGWLASCDLRRSLRARSTDASHPTDIPRADDGERD
jgi:hypothetical protein